MMLSKQTLFVTVSILLLASCSEPTPASSASAKPAAGASLAQAAPSASDPAVGQAATAAPAPVSTIAASTSPAAQALDSAVWPAQATTPQAKRDVMTRIQVLLARAHVSPGVIDGQDGGNVKNAIAAFEQAHGLTADGVMDAETWAALSQDTQPTVTDYVITEADVKGPFLAKIPTDYTQMAKLDALAFTSPLEALAEKFHMDESLLKALNPGADFAVAGTRLLVAAVGPQVLPGAVARIEVDKSSRQVRAYGADEKLLAVYPATVGSSERPAPEGEWAVRAIAPDPTYTYDPSRLTFGKAAQGKLTIKAGPNNPVGSTWIDLTKDTYGIHGTPDPRLVGKTASHGCVRLTNWDVRQLSQAVKAGAKVTFVGTEASPKA